MVKRRIPLQQRAPPVPEFNEEKRQADNESIERHMANFFADLSKNNKTDFLINKPPTAADASQNKEQKTNTEQNTTTTNDAAKKIDKSKLDKISQLLASKKQEVNAASASATTPKVDLNDKLKNIFQKNGLTGSTGSSASASAALASTTQEKITTQNDNVTLNKKEEYDPARPNDYEQLKRIINKQKQDLEKFKNFKSLSETAEEEQSTQQNTQQNTQRLSYNDDIMEEEDDGPYTFGLGSNRNNQMQVEKDTEDLYSKTEYETSEEKAYKMMEKQGFKLGQGLGKNQQGIVAPIIAQKISDTSAIITQSTMDLSSILPQEVVMKRYFEQRNLTPTKVVCLINLVAPYEIDEDLEEEITQECFNFGNVVNLKIYVMSSEDCEDAVRIFVKYEYLDESMNAFTNLDGRIFNGRSVLGYFYPEDLFEINQLSNRLS